MKFVDVYKLFIYRILSVVRINGHWGRWSDWSTCDVSCDDGKRKRFRKCDNPEPKHGGKYCAGESVEEGVCTMKRCQLSENKF